MKKMKIAILLSAIVIAVGLILALVGLLIMRFDFGRLELSRYQSKTHEVVEDFNSIVIDVDTADVILRLSTDGVCRVSCFENDKRPHTVTVQDGVLQIGTTEGKWYHNIQLFNFSEPSITVSLPKSAYDELRLRIDTGDAELPAELSFTNATVTTDTGDVHLQSAVADALSVTTDTGDIEITGVSPTTLTATTDTGEITVSDSKIAEALAIRTDTGEVKLCAIECGTLALESSTGDVTLKNLLATGAVSITTNTGDVDLDGCDAAAFTITTDTGDVWGILLSEKVFIVDTDTGRKNVPKTSSGGRCEITTDTGNIIITID